MWLTWLKTCPRCGETKESSEFPIASARADGRYQYCRSCRAELDVKIYRRGARTRIVTNGRVCTACREFKPLDQFYANRKNTLGVVSHCKSCMSAIYKARYRRRKQIGDNQIESPWFWPGDPRGQTG